MKYKLLVAEDAEAERLALCKTLNDHLGGTLTILEATNGSEALSLYERERPEIAILNIEMPGLSGLEVAQRIRETDKNCGLLFLSDFDNFFCAKQAIALRALDYILKPYDEKKLVLSVMDAIQYSAHLGSIPWQNNVLLHSDSAENTADFSETTRLSLVREDISKYIESHYMEELSMKNVAYAMNYSDAYFCKLFKQCFHMNFSTYLNEFRIRRAKDMMGNPRITVKDISLACGYTDSNYFSRVFKRITGQTPTEYRLAIMEKAFKN